MTLEIKKLDEKRFELVESNTVVKTKEELKMFKKNLVEHVAKLNAQGLEAQKVIHYTENSIKQTLLQLQKVNMTLGLPGADGLPKTEKVKE